jgi:hypothetical protein
MVLQEIFCRQNGKSSIEIAGLLRGSFAYHIPGKQSTLSTIPTKKTLRITALYKNKIKIIFY